MAKSCAYCSLCRNHLLASKDELTEGTQKICTNGSGNPIPISCTPIYTLALMLGPTKELFKQVMKAYLKN